MKLTTMLLAMGLASATCLAQTTSSGQAQIGAPSDGTTYTVVTSTQVEKADAVRCGMNDASAPNMGIFRAELRQYTEYKDGKVVRTWRDTVDVFDHCYEP